VPGPSSRTAPLCGIAATAVTLGVAELLAGLLVRLSGGSGTPSPLLAVGGAFVDRTPTWLKNWAVETFGTADKVALGVGIGVTLIVLGALIGWLGARSRNLALAIFVVVGLVGVVAVASRPSTTAIHLIPTALGLWAGAWALLTLLARAVTAPDPDRVPSVEGEPSRRGVLGAAVGLGALGALGILAGQTLARTGRAARDVIATLGLPSPTRTVAVPPSAVSDIAGHTRF